MNRLLPALALAASLAAASTALAEAGLPRAFCREASCACGAQPCTCGQVCDTISGTCQPAQAGFCVSDLDCHASCDRFICDGNVCVRGTRVDGGVVRDGGGRSTDGGCGEAPPLSPGCQATASSTLLGGALLGALARRKRRANPQTSP